jgi:hypothetical protein
MTIPSTRVNLLASLLVGACVCWSSARAESNTVYDFLRNDVSARAAGLAGSFFTVSDDPNAFFYNPASLPTITGPKGSIGFFKHIMDINSGHLSYAQEFEGVGHFGAGVVFTDYGSFTETDATGSRLGEFGATDVALTVGYGTMIEENLSVGASAKFVYSSLAGYSSTGAALDAGILLRFPEARAAIGASLRNLGAQLGTYGGVNEPLPLDLSIGGSITPKGLPLLLNVAFHRLTDDVDSFGERFSAFTVGGEFTLSSVLQLRLGYDNARRKDLKLGTSVGLAGFSAGIGITVDRYVLDYALSSLGEVGSLHRISIGARF